MDDLMLYTGLVVANTNVNNYKPWHRSYKEKTQVKTGIGIIINLREDSYVLTCLHGIKNAYELNFYTFDLENGTVNKIKMDIATISTELDITLLKFNQNNLTDSMAKMNLQDKQLSLDKFEKRLPKIGSKLKLHLLDQKQKSNDHVDIVKNIYDGIVENITFENQQSFNMPRMPYIYAKSSELLRDKYDYSELKGISGSVVFDEKNNILGIISSITDEGLLSIVPSVTICRFIEEFVETSMFNGLCDIISQLAFCSIDTEESN